MGLFSSSKKTTTNQDNRTINDYSGADFSQSYDIDESITGNNNNNQGTINITDGGAFELAHQANVITAGIASEAFSLSDNAMTYNAQLAQSLGSDAIQAGLEVGNLAQGMHDTNTAFVSASQTENLAFADSIFQASQYSLNQANQNTLDASLQIVNAGLQSHQINNDLARDLVAQTGEQAFAQQQDNNNALNNGFKSMMQFAESYSRSDGAQLAETNLKTIGVLSLAFIAGLVIYKKVN